MEKETWEAYSRERLTSNFMSFFSVPMTIVRFLEWLRHRKNMQASYADIRIDFLVGVIGQQEKNTDYFAKVLEHLCESGVVSIIIDYDKEDSDKEVFITLLPHKNTRRVYPLGMKWES